MARKKKAATVDQPISAFAQQYYDLWIQLNLSHEEFEIDEIREQMNELWADMSKQDKREFQIKSDQYERSHPVNYR